MAKRQHALRLAVATPTISHFETPLYRILGGGGEIELMVFHADSLQRSRFDIEHQTVIDWGRDVVEGFSETRCESTTTGIGKDLWTWNPDVVLLYGYSWPGALKILLEAKIRRIPIVFRGTISPLLDPRRSKGWSISRALRPAVLRLFDAHHFGGDYSRSAITAAGVPESNLYFVPYSVDSGYFEKGAKSSRNRRRAEALRREWGWSENDFLVLFLSQQNWVKGVDLAIPTMAKLQQLHPNAKLVMAGSGSLSADVKRAAEDSLEPGSFVFPGFLPSYETIPYYLACDVSFYPSRYDTWARGVNEAMLCGRPCLVTDRVAASGGLVDDGMTGMVVEGTDPNTMAHRLAEFAASSLSRRREMGEAARVAAWRYSYEENADTALRSILERTR